MTRSTALLVVAALAAGGALAFAALRGPAPPASLDDRVRGVASTLRCPVCENLSVADSPSSLAAEMRRTIARRLARGATPDEIRDGFVRAYGAWVLQAPPPEGINLLAWLAPVAAVAGGGAVAILASRRWRRPDPPARRPAPDRTGP
jgi:cytochrome c-type biogenesis protein CcmH